MTREYSSIISRNQQHKNILTNKRKIQISKTVYFKDINMLKKIILKKTYKYLKISKKQTFRLSKLPIKEISWDISKEDLYSNKTTEGSLLDIKQNEYSTLTLQNKLKKIRSISRIIDISALKIKWKFEINRKLFKDFDIKFSLLNDILQSWDIIFFFGGKYSKRYDHLLQVFSHYPISHVGLIKRDHTHNYYHSQHNTKI